MIPVEKREKYMQALERVIVNHDITSFATFLGYLVDKRKKDKAVEKVPINKI